ncbi:hypothetical protein NM688_g5443 [Phlebia brevispora]|uniref:Uncharacterized protein n=1 Tax=Phlebia brevispora TaxID=194682 RepID=A0ACC1SVC4_9APHY|nr:hypothetical protein NM688_g5443 [Phlebia brevispora]
MPLEAYEEMQDQPQPSGPPPTYNESAMDAILELNMQPQLSGRDVGDEVSLYAPSVSSTNGADMPVSILSRSSQRLRSFPQPPQPPQPLTVSLTQSSPSSSSSVPVVPPAVGPGPVLSYQPSVQYADLQPSAVRYKFSHLGPLTMVLVPPSSALDTRPLYHISWRPDYFNTVSVVTTIRKGANESGSFVAEFGLGAVRFGAEAEKLLKYAFPKVYGRSRCWQWKRNGLGLIWSQGKKQQPENVLTYTCVQDPGANEKLLATWRPPSYDVVGPMRSIVCPDLGEEGTGDAIVMTGTTCHQDCAWWTSDLLLASAEKFVATATFVNKAYDPEYSDHNITEHTAIDAEQDAKVARHQRRCGRRVVAVGKTAISATGDQHVDIDKAWRDERLRFLPRRTMRVPWMQFWSWVCNPPPSERDLSDHASLYAPSVSTVDGANRSGSAFSRSLQRLRHSPQPSTVSLPQASSSSSSLVPAVLPASGPVLSYQPSVHDIRPQVPVRYSFSQSGSSSMILVPPSTALDTRPLYYISWRQDFFNPISVVTTIRRGANESGPFVAEFGLGAVRFGSTEQELLKNIFPKFSWSSKSWQWKRNGLGLLWTAGKKQPENVLIYRCIRDPGPNQTVIATWRPPSYNMLGPMRSCQLKIMPAGHDYLDDIVLCALIVDRMELERQVIRSFQRD